MSDQAKRRIQMFCSAAGFTYIGIVVFGWGLVAGMLPPHQPSAGPDEIARLINDNAFRIRIGMLITMVGAAVCMPFTAALARYIARIEGTPGVLTYSAIMGGTGNMVLTFYPAIFWLVACFRPERSADLIYLMNDWAWLQLIGGATMFWSMPLAMAVAALCDRSPTPVFPRWSGYVCIWMFLAILPDQLLFFFQTGPFAWNGIFGIWLPLGAFGGWFLLASYLMVRAMKRGIAPDSPSA